MVLAQLAVGLSGGNASPYQGTLAAAYAEAGQFTEAVKTASDAIGVATQRNDAELADSTRARLRFYQAGKAWHESPLAKPE